MMLKELKNECEITFAGFNYSTNKIVSVKKYFVVDCDYFNFFLKKYFHLNVSLDLECHKAEIGLKKPCICIKNMNNETYISAYYKELSIQEYPFENYHLNCFEKHKKNLYYKKYFYTKDKDFIKNTLKEYKIKNNNFDGLEICKGSSYRHKHKSDKLAIIDEDHSYKKLEVINFIRFSIYFLRFQFNNSSVGIIYCI